MKSQKGLQTGALLLHCIYNHIKNNKLKTNQCPIQELLFMTQTFSQLEGDDVFNRASYRPFHAATGARACHRKQRFPGGAYRPNRASGHSACHFAPVGEATTEAQALAELKTSARQNQRYKSFIVMDYSAGVTPAATR